MFDESKNVIALFGRCDSIQAANSVNSNDFIWAVLTDNPVERVGRGDVGGGDRCVRVLGGRVAVVDDSRRQLGRGSTLERLQLSRVAHRRTKELFFLCNAFFIFLSSPEVLLQYQAKKNHKILLIIYYP